MFLLLSVSATVLVAAFAYRVANRRLQYRHNRLQLEVLVSFAFSVLFGRLLTIEELRQAEPFTSLVRLAGFVAMFTMLVAATRLMRALRSDEQRGQAG